MVGSADFPESEISEILAESVGALLPAAVALPLDGLVVAAVWGSAPGWVRRRAGSRHAQLPALLPWMAATSYGRRVNVDPPEPARRVWQAMLTWRAQDLRRMESVRIQVSGKRIRANGRIVAAATAANPAFGAHYDVQTDETGATKSLGMTVTLAERERVLAIARDEENMWLVTDHRGERREAYNGALDVDVVFSPFFNALPIRRLGLHERAVSATLPVVYVNVPDMSVTAASVSYTSTGGPDGIKLRSPVADTIVRADDEGFIVDYPGLAERI